MGCPNYFAWVYLHLAIACAIAFCSAEFLTGFMTNWVGFFINTVIIFLSLFGIFITAPGSALQYLCFVVFAVSAGQNSQIFLKEDEKDQTLSRILITLGGIFVGMTALGFYDRQNLLGFGPYLSAGLLGLIFGQLGYMAYLFAGGKEKAPLSYLSDFGVLLFTIYLAYDTQRLKQQAGICKIPNYPSDSLGLFLDIANLFNLLSSR
jgi:FtsH-binding integral membrane protein